MKMCKKYNFKTFFSRTAVYAKKIQNQFCRTVIDSYKFNNHFLPKLFKKSAVVKIHPGRNFYEQEI